MSGAAFGQATNANSTLANLQYNLSRLGLSSNAQQSGNAANASQLFSAAQLLRGASPQNAGGAFSHDRQ
jgi:hypothetical protein